MTHHVLTGIERGMYNNDTITLHKDCFGKKYVKRINWLAAMFQHDIWGNWIQELMIFYQLYYMWSERCKLDLTLNDVYLYCWNKGCYPEELWGNTEKNFLYMTRALIDAAIVWFEGVPATYEENPTQWENLSRQTGETVAEIVKEITNF